MTVLCAHVGTVDGCVRIQAAAGGVWEAPVHDSRRGAVTCLALSADDGTLLSASADGTLLLLDNPLLAPGAALPGSSAPASLQLPSLADVAAPEAVDIIDPAALCLEEAEEQAAASQHAAQAADAREGVRAQVAALRAQFQALAAANKAAAPGAQLPASAFAVDAGGCRRTQKGGGGAPPPHIHPHTSLPTTPTQRPHSTPAPRVPPPPPLPPHTHTPAPPPPLLPPLPAALPAMVEAERAQAFDRVRRQAAWRGEAASLLLRKLTAFFTGQLACERFLVLPLGAAAGPGVASLRAARLAPEVQASWGARALLLRG